MTAGSTALPSCWSPPRPWTSACSKRNVTIVDTLWPLLFVSLRPSYALAAPARPARQAVAALVSPWGLRLAIHLLAQPRPREDRRYQAIRRRNEPNFAFKSLYLIFGFQALLAWVISLPLAGAIAGVAPSAGSIRWGSGCGWWDCVRGRRRLATRALQADPRTPVT